MIQVELGVPDRIPDAIGNRFDVSTASVEKDDIIKGYEYSKGEYIQIDPQEIANLRIPSRHTLELQQFVNLKEIDLSERPAGKGEPSLGSASRTPSGSSPAPATMKVGGRD